MQLEKLQSDMELSSRTSFSSSLQLSSSLSSFVLPTDLKTRGKQKLSSLYLSYCSNILKETNEWTLVIDNKDDLAGLPDGSIAVAAEEAAKPAPVPEDIALLREIRDALKKN